jgi:hypothetical protein
MAIIDRAGNSSHQGDHPITVVSTGLKLAVRQREG